MQILTSLRKRAGGLKTEVYALYLAYRDPRVPFYAKAFLAIIIGYALSPIDLIPDFIPVLGYLDDLVIVPLGVFLALKMIPEEVMEECREKARTESISYKGKWVAAIIIVIMWLIAIYVILRLIF